MGSVLYGALWCDMFLTHDVCGVFVLCFLYFRVFCVGRASIAVMVSRFLRVLSLLSLFALFLSFD